MFRQFGDTKQNITLLLDDLLPWGRRNGIIINFSRLVCCFFWPIGSGNATDCLSIYICQCYYCTVPVILVSSLHTDLPLQGLSRQIRLALKGQSHEIFCTRFSPQTAPPGPIRDILGPFWFFLLLGWVISILKWLPGVLCTRESRLPGVLSTGESKLPGVLGTRELRLPGVLSIGESRLPGVLGTGESRLPSVLCTG